MVTRIHADGGDRSVPALVLKGIVKSFPGVRALRGVSFDVFPGEVHALLGENGAGKSTLIKILSGVHSPDEGEVRVGGKVVHFTEPGQAQHAGIATIYQEFSLYPELSVAENIFSGHIPRSFGGFALDWARAEREAAKLLESLDASDIDVRIAHRHIICRKSAACGDRQGAVSSGARTHTGRADRRAHTARR